MRGARQLLAGGAARARNQWPARHNACTVEGCRVRKRRGWGGGGVERVRGERREEPDGGAEGRINEEASRAGRATGGWREGSGSRLTAPAGHHSDCHPPAPPPPVTSACQQAARHALKAGSPGTGHIITQRGKGKGRYMTAAPATDAVERAAWIVAMTHKYTCPRFPDPPARLPFQPSLNQPQWQRLKEKPN
jgi:hypothetical protein